MTENNKNNDTLRKLNESFGTSDPSTNIEGSYSISPDSEDDKPQTGKPDLSLKDKDFGNNDSPVQAPDDTPTSAQDAFSDKVVDEQNGPASSLNKSGSYSISPDSEDDKPQTGKPDLSLQDKDFGNNDSPVQDPSEVVTPEQQRISEQILAQEEKLQKMNEQVKADVDSFQKNVKSSIEEAEKEYNEAGGLKGLAQEKAIEVKKAMEDDPKGTLLDLGKKALMVAGAFSLLKMIFKK